MVRQPQLINLLNSLLWFSLSKANIVTYTEENNKGNFYKEIFYSASVRHMVALMAVLHHCVHQTHIKHHAKTILFMLIKRHFRFK